jgi:hypothetical protein
MRKSLVEKLTLRRETLRVFQETALRTVAGGGPTAIDCSVTCLGIHRRPSPDQTSYNC